MWRVQTTSYYIWKFTRNGRRPKNVTHVTPHPHVTHTRDNKHGWQHWHWVHPAVLRHEYVIHNESRRTNMVTVRIVVRVGVANAVLATAYMHRVGSLDEGGCSNCKTRSEPGWNKTMILCIHGHMRYLLVFFCHVLGRKITRYNSSDVRIFRTFSLCVFLCCGGWGCRLRTEWRWRVWLFPLPLGFASRRVTHSLTHSEWDECKIKKVYVCFMIAETEADTR